MSKTPRAPKPERMSLSEITLKLLAEAKKPVSAHELWLEAVRQELDKCCTSKAERPETTMAACLYKWAREKRNDVTAEGSYPVKFRMAPRKH